jgi:serine protease Do
MSKSIKSILSKQSIIIIVVISFVVSTVIGFIAGSAAFELSRYVNQNKFLQQLIPKKHPQDQATQNINETNLSPNNGVIDRETRIIKAVKETTPAVVSIIISKDLPVLEQYMSNPFDDFFQNSPFGDDNSFNPFNFQIPQYRQKGTEKQEIGGGTGFVISEDGLILTNRHVVSDKEAEYTVLASDGTKYEASVVARDRLQDLAFLRVKNLKIKPLKLGNSDDIQIGQTAITIGNALGEFSNTVNVGVISGLKRTITASSGLGAPSEELDQIIQTDAAINRGNSGGPLLNLQGEVIGVNTAMAMGAENIGFAIPINVAKRSIQEIIKNGEIAYPYLGVRYVIINKTIQEQNNLSVDYGALIIKGSLSTELAVMPGSPADKAGFRENDIILEVDGEQIDEKNTLAKVILNSQVGQEISLKVLSRGVIKNIKVKLEKIPTNFD